MKIKMPIIMAAATILAVGCDQQQRQAKNDNSSLDQSKDTVQQSVKDAKNEVDRQAKAQKEMLDKEAKSAQAKIDAEKARAQANASDADQKVAQASQNVQDAAGSASAKAQSEVGAKNSADITPPASTSPAMSDDKLTEQVQSAIKAKNTDATAAQNIQVSVSSGVVTLKGSVKSDAEKTEMENAAKNVTGVSRVDNQLEVKAQ